MDSLAHPQRGVGKCDIPSERGLASLDERPLPRDDLPNGSRGGPPGGILRAQALPDRRGFQALGTQLEDAAIPSRFPCRCRPPTVSAGVRAEPATAPRPECEPFATDTAGPGPSPDPAGQPETAAGAEPGLSTTAQNHLEGGVAVRTPYREAVRLPGLLVTGHRAVLLPPSRPRRIDPAGPPALLTGDIPLTHLRADEEARPSAVPPPRPHFARRRSESLATARAVELHGAPAPYMTASIRAVEPGSFPQPIRVQREGFPAYLALHLHLLPRGQAEALLRAVPPWWTVAGPRLFSPTLLADNHRGGGCFSQPIASNRAVDPPTLPDSS